MKTKIIKIAGIIALVLLVLFTAVGIWLKLFFPSDQVRRLVESRLAAATGRECTVGEVGISLRRGFAVDLSAIKIASRPDEISPYLLSADNLYLRFRLLPLLKRRVEIVSLLVLSPEIYLERDTEGSFNLTRALKKEPGEVEEEPEEPEGFSLVLLAVSVQDATVHYLDQKSKLEIALGPLEVRLALSGLNDSQSPPRIEGRAHLKGVISSSSPAVSRLGAILPLETNLSATLETAGEESSFEEISLESITMDFTGIRLIGAGRLFGLGSEDFGYSVALQGTTDELASLSGMLAEGVPVKDLKGSIQLDAKLEGRPGAEHGPEFVLQAALENLSASIEDFPRQVSRLNGALTLDKSQVRVESLEALIGPDPLSLAGRILLEEHYPFSLHLKAGLELDGLPRLVPALEGWYTAGKIEADLNLAGLLDNIKGLYADGTLNGRQVALQPPQGIGRLELPQVYFSLAGHDIEKSEIELVARASRLNLRAGIKNYPALLFQDKTDTGPASWRLDAAGSSLNLLDFFPPDSAGQDKDAEKQSALKNYNLPFSLGSGSGTLRAARLIITPEISLDSVDLAFAVQDSLITIQRLKAGLFSGSLAGEGNITLGKTGFPGYVLNLKASGVNASRLLSPFSKLGTYLTGSLSTGIDLERRKGGEKSLDENLAGTAEFTLSQGRLKGWPALQGLARLTKIEELNDLAIEQWLGKFEIRDERVHGDNLEIETTVSDLLVSGSVGFDGSLDYSLGLVLSEALSRKYRSRLPGEIAGLLTGDEERLELNFTISGTTDDPRVNWDTRPVTRRLGKKLGRQLNKLIDRLLPSKSKKADTTGAAGDSAAEQSKDEPAKDLPGLLKSLFKKKKEPN